MNLLESAFALLGPLMVVLAIVLILLVARFVALVAMPELLGSTGPLLRLNQMYACFMLANILFNYILAATTKPGTAKDYPLQLEDEEKRAIRDRGFESARSADPALDSVTADHRFRFCAKCALPCLTHCCRFLSFSQSLRAWGNCCRQRPQASSRPPLLHLQAMRAQNGPPLSVAE